jgi:hypothetical protein
MKLVIISIFVLIVAVQMYIARSTQQTEQHAYKVIKKFDKFEIRKYEAALFSSVRLNKKGYKESSSEGFVILAATDDTVEKLEPQPEQNFGLSKEYSVPLPHF